MSLLTIIVVVVAVGIVVECVRRYAPIPGGFKNIIYVVAIGAVLWWLIEGLSLARHFPRVHC